MLSLKLNLKKANTINQLSRSLKDRTQKSLAGFFLTASASKTAPGIHPRRMRGLLILFKSAGQPDWRDLVSFLKRDFNAKRMLIIQIESFFSLFNQVGQPSWLKRVRIHSIVLNLVCQL